MKADHREPCHARATAHGKKAPNSNIAGVNAAADSNAATTENAERRTPKKIWARTVTTRLPLLCTLIFLRIFTFQYILFRTFRLLKMPPRLNEMIFNYILRNFFANLWHQTGKTQQIGNKTGG